MTDPTAGLPHRRGLIVAIESESDLYDARVVDVSVRVILADKRRMFGHAAGVPGYDLGFFRMGGSVHWYEGSPIARIIAPGGSSTFVVTGVFIDWPLVGNRRLAATPDPPARLITVGDET